MAVRTFPLFKPAMEDPPEDLPASVADVFDREVRRAALMGSDPEADVRLALTVDLPSTTLDALQALANATGSSRRAMGSKLLTAAIWEAVNELHRHAQELPEYEAVLSEFSEAFNEARAARE